MKKLYADGCTPVIVGQLVARTTKATVKATASPDFVVVGHGPHVVAVVPQTVKADRWLDDNVAYDEDYRNYCGGGLIVERTELKEFARMIGASGLTILGGCQ